MYLSTVEVKLWPVLAEFGGNKPKKGWSRVYTNGEVCR